MAQFDKTFPTLDCAACILTPKMVDAGSHPNITLHTWSEVTDVSGYVGNFTVKVLHRPRYVDTDLCTGCGICQEKCPAKVVDTGLRGRHRLSQGHLPAVPAGGPQVPGPRPGQLHLLREGHLQGLREVLPTGRDRLQPAADEEVTLQVGNIVLATGFEPFDARRVEPYGYGRLPNVFTSLEFERMSNASGPTGGRIVLRDGVTEPQAVAIVHCVGSRDRNYNNYCSAICCMQSTEVRAPRPRAHRRRRLRVLHRHPGARQGASTSSTSASRTRARSSSAAASPRSPTSCGCPEEADQDGRLIVQVEDTLAGRQRRIPVDMVVLSVGLEPQPDAERGRPPLRHHLQLRGLGHRAPPQARPGRDDDRGRLRRRLRPRPARHPLQRRQRRRGRGADPGRIQQGEMALEPIRASRRRGALLRLPDLQRPLPVQRDLVRRGRVVTEVNPALCQGCGVCVAACPAGAIAGTGFSDAQILAQIEGLLMDAFKVRRRQRPRSGGGAGMTAVMPTPDQVAAPAASVERLRAGHPRLHLQLVQLPGRGPGRHRPDQVPAQRPPRPAHVLGPPRPDVRPEGLRARRRRRHHDRLLAGRLPLPDPERQGAAALPAPATRAGGPRHRAHAAPALLRQRRRGPALADEITRISRRSGRSGRSGIRDRAWRSVARPAAHTPAAEAVEVRA